MDENQLHKITGLFEEMKTGYAKLTADIAQYGTGNGETKEKLAKQQEELVSIKAEIQKANEERNAFAGSVNERLSALSAGKQMDQKSLGELVVENPDFISAVKGGGRVRWASQFKGSIQQF